MAAVHCHPRMLAYLIDAVSVERVDCENLPDQVFDTVGNVDSDVVFALHYFTIELGLVLVIFEWQISDHHRK